MKEDVANVLNIKTKDGKPFDIPLQGSLGLLALGDLGLMAWRKKKMEVYERLQDQKPIPKK